MYTIEVGVQGTAVLLQHAFGVNKTTEMEASSKKVSGKVDYSEEWRDTCYVLADGNLYQPAIHFESSMIKAALNFKIPGRRGKTYKDLFKAAVFVRPDAIAHGVKVPEDPGINKLEERVYVDVRPVVVQRARVLRARLALRTGWSLTFDIDVMDDQLPAEVVNEVLVEAGQRVGVGDYRPRFGRFMVTKFEVR